MLRPYKEMPQTKEGAKRNEWLLFAHSNGGVKRTLKLLKEGLIELPALREPRRLPAPEGDPQKASARPEAAESHV